jgi:hypothetical protein
VARRGVDGKRRRGKWGCATGLGLFASTSHSLSQPSHASMTSYGTALPDSSLLVASHSDSLISLLPTISSFLAHRATLERDYAKALSTATSKARLVAIKESSERSGGGDKSGTLEGGWLKVLEAADWDARQHLARADALTSGVVDGMSTSAVLLERVRKKVSSMVHDEGPASWD